MQDAIPMVELWRGEFLESVHRGHAVVCDERGEIVEAWGDPQKIILPRSSCKMVQALPLVESGAADALGLTAEQLALSCASHNAAAIHTDRVALWLRDLGLSDDDFRCGPQSPGDMDARLAMVRAGEEPCQIHNNCSGKHSGFLSLNQHIRGGPEYIEADHPLQKMIRAAFEECTDETSPGYGIDGCSAPNFATSLHGLARAAARFASADGDDARSRAMRRLREAMMLHPELVAGEGRACTELMRAAKGKAAIKGGAEAMYVAILPEKRLGVALKIEDGTSRGSECAIASILVRLGVVEPDDPLVLKRRNAEIRNRNGIMTGYVHPAAGF
ncbi:L-Asparaginase type 2-like protein [Candidatus Rhodobacter oscarellae]|uniref:L-Asparaginase type 2-like protein n=1 Tax=Candidatus Rhodobacter oscarellae TaxID=1675527 RepID=A0A0J9EB64_9RHOB|nr:asparaginase [Candidatus Rhodobacter lobularis]KMW58924.1 L-Asparaginase type 2-like protein [Candidatus Rhodobacter lobularis]